MNKNYIVTMADYVTQADAFSMLSKTQSSPKDAVMALETDDFDENSDVLMIEELCTYFISLSEQEAKDLCKNNGVIAVEEDTEVFALNSQFKPDDGEGIGETLDCSSEFEMGYYRALADLNLLPANFSISDGCDTELTGFARPRKRSYLPRTRHVCAPNCYLPQHLTPRPQNRLHSELQQSIPWNISMVQADKAWARATGRGIKIAILDTGIDEDHPDLAVYGGVSFVPNVSSWDDVNGHGTHCAGIAAARNNASGVVGVAPDAELYAVKVLDQNGRGFRSWIISGMMWCVRNGIRVASMSLGSTVDAPNAPCSIAYENAAKLLEDAHCLVVAAAGNSGREHNHWVGNPARCPGFMAVAAIDQNERKAEFSSWGPPTLGNLESVEISAPGVKILSTVPGGSHATKSGTSMACPHVSGAAAIVAQMRPTWKPAQIRARLKATARDLGASGSDPQFGSGLLDCVAAIS